MGQDWEQVPGAGLSERVKVSFRTQLIAGIVLLVPVVVTFIVLRIVFQWLDGSAQPLVKQLFQIQADIPGLGIVLTLAVVWLAGVLASNVFGKRMVGRGDVLLRRLPLIGSIYGPVKQFIETVVAAENREGFHRVVLAEYPTDGRWILGFATGTVRLDEEGTVGRCVFVPTSPNPATGWTVIFPPEKVRNTPLTVEEAMRLIVSAGVVIPENLKTLGAYGLSPESEGVLKISTIEEDPDADQTRSRA